jgi:predicted protein tyrosine phosphatase
MKIWVSPLSEVHNVVAAARPERVVSLLGATPFPEIAGYDEDRHYRVNVDDVREEREGWITPGAEHVSGIVTFLKDWRLEAPLLIHCWAGISRSTATAFIAACLHNPETDEGEIARELRRASPTAWPNARIVALADDILGRKGRMAAAIEALGPGDFAEEAEPFFIRARF